MVRLYKKRDLEKYLKEDFILESLKKHPDADIFASHKWLLDIPAKRFIYSDVYGPFLKSAGKKILDIGGGYCGLSREIANNHDYTLADIMAHDDHPAIKQESKKWGFKLHLGDWRTLTPEKYDVVIANDIFPNVDQRLAEFIRTFKPLAKKIIVTLTTYEQERSYTVKRVDADEVFFICPWNAKMTELVLKQALPAKVILPKSRLQESMFKNGRIVYRMDI